MIRVQLRAVLLLTAASCGASTVQAVNIPTVPIGNLGNPSDPLTGLGSVSYNYSIGTTEVTVGQYAEFLNAVAVDHDIVGLYQVGMATDELVKGIARSGSEGSYSYSVIGSPNRPVPYISWFSAMRFVNWLNNGQPSGPIGPATTETGAYNMPDGSYISLVPRTANARWFLPNTNEWYKAAYFQPASEGGDTDNYWAYPTQTNDIPYSDNPPGTEAPDPSNTANFYRNDGISNGYNEGYGVNGFDSDHTTAIAEVGAYTAASSYYGTFEQGGNLSEWIETPGSTRDTRGGAYSQTAEYLSSTPPSTTAGSLNGLAGRGFRVATRPVETAVTTPGVPTNIALNGGSATTGGVSVALIASTTGSFSQIYNTVDPARLPPSIAFSLGNFLLHSPGELMQYWDLHFSGSLSGPATVTFAFDASLVAIPETVGIWHYKTPGGWEYLGGIIDGNKITVTTTSFSPFVLALAPTVVPEPASGVSLVLGLVLVAGWHRKRRHRFSEASASS